MSIRGDGEKQELVDGIVRRARKGKGKRANDIDRFLRRFFANIAPQDFIDVGPDEFFGGAVSLWEFARARKLGESSIRIYNPGAKANGWTSRHTVVEIINDDMPFLVDSVTAELKRQNLTVHLFDVEVHFAFIVFKHTLSRYTFH